MVKEATGNNIKVRSCSQQVCIKGVDFLMVYVHVRDCLRSSGHFDILCENETVKEGNTEHNRTLTCVVDTTRLFFTRVKAWLAVLLTSMVLKVLEHIAGFGLCFLTPIEGIAKV